MQCHRCNSEMIMEEFIDLYDDTGHFNFRGWRCFICGNVFDPVISANRRLHPPPISGKKRKLVVGVN